MFSKTTQNIAIERKCLVIQHETIAIESKCLVRQHKT